MKKLQQFCAALTLTLILSLSIFAGEISCPGLAVDPPAPTQQNSTIGDIGTPGIYAKREILTPNAASLDLLTEVTLNLLQRLSSFF
jgi:hypothetical protein